MQKRILSDIILDLMRVDDVEKMKTEKRDNAIECLAHVLEHIKKDALLDKVFADEIELLRDLYEVSTMTVSDADNLDKADKMNVELARLQHAFSVKSVHQRVFARPLKFFGMGQYLMELAVKSAAGARQDVQSWSDLRSESTRANKLSVPDDDGQLINGRRIAVDMTEWEAFSASLASLQTNGSASFLKAAESKLEELDKKRANMVVVLVKASDSIISENAWELCETLTGKLHAPLQESKEEEGNFLSTIIAKATGIKDKFASASSGLAEMHRIASASEAQAYLKRDVDIGEGMTDVSALLPWLREVALGKDARGATMTENVQKLFCATESLKKHGDLLPDSFLEELENFVVDPLTDHAKEYCHTFKDICVDLWTQGNQYESVLEFGEDEPTRSEEIDFLTQVCTSMSSLPRTPLFRWQESEQNFEVHAEDFNALVKCLQIRSAYHRLSLARVLKLKQLSLQN